MKKILLSIGAVAAVFSAEIANAQLAMTDFNTGLPATWSMIKVDNNVPSTSLNATIVAALTGNAWMTRLRATGDSCMLTTSSFTPAGTADRWLLTPAFTVTDAKMIITWEDVEGVSGVLDSLQVWVSPTAGNTVPSFTTKLYEGPVGDFATDVSGSLIYVKKGVSLAAYVGQSIRIAFRNHSTNQGTSRLDNVGTEIMTNKLDASVVSVSFPKIVATTSTNPVTVNIKNMGSDNITSLNLTYTVDAGAPVTQTFSGLNIYPYGTASLTFTTPISNPAVGNHIITVNAVQVNGAADPNSANNQATFGFVVATQTTTRAGLIEEFSSSTCSPCASFNLWFDPLVTTNNGDVPSSNFNIIKYQMNWPSPGTDLDYNASGSTRRGYYGVNAIPDHFTNGAPGTSFNSTTAQTEINNSKVAPAFMSMTGTYQYSTDSLFVTATITPYFTLTGLNFSFIAAATERNYSRNDATTTVGQHDFYHVERVMFPNGTGTAITSLTAGVPVTYTFKKPYVIGGVAQSNDNFAGSPSASDLVIFVQDNSDKSVMQSLVIPAAPKVTGIQQIEGINNVMLYPNPSKGNATVLFETTEATNLYLSVSDILGRVVYTAEVKLNSGTQNISIPSAQFIEGLYNVKILTEKGSMTERLSVIK
jgi:Secretion system C-terminal sorting domain